MSSLGRFGTFVSASEYTPRTAGIPPSHSERYYCPHNKRLAVLSEGCWETFRDVEVGEGKPVEVAAVSRQEAPPETDNYRSGEANPGGMAAGLDRAVVPDHP